MAEAGGQATNQSSDRPRGFVEDDPAGASRHSVRVANPLTRN
jgi:hypothetical protein